MMLIYNIKESMLNIKKKLEKKLKDFPFEEKK
jgi:hypothetical protein